MYTASKLKQGATVITGLLLTIVMFPFVLATTTFLMVAGLIAAFFGVYRLRKLAKQYEGQREAGTVSSDGVTIEGSYYVVHPVR